MAERSAFGRFADADRRLVKLEHMFDTGKVQDTAPPTPATLAALEACALAAAEERRAHARSLAALAALARTDAVAETGHRNLARLLEEHLRLDPAEARRRLRHATLLDTGPPAVTGPWLPTEPDLPATAETASEGLLDPDHIATIDKTVQRLRRVVPTLPPAVLDETERQLADLARARSPRQLTDAAHDVLLRLDPDGDAPHDAERPVEELRINTGRDGSLTGRFRFDEPEAAEAIRSAITARTPAPEPDADTSTLRPGRALHERRAEALRALVDDAGPADPTDDTVHTDTATDAPPMAPNGPTPPTRGERPSRETTMIVTVALETLTGADADRHAGPRQWQGPAAHGLGLLDGRYAVSAETARRLACEAAIIPAVLGTRGEILDLGRKTRVVSTAQRRAVVVRDRHCAHPGCRRSPRRCDVHHVVPWFLDGRTDLANLVLLCPYHHHQVHHSGWEIHMRHGVPWFVPPAWLDPLRRPRSNRTAAWA